MKKQTNLSKMLEELAEISQWFKKGDEDIEKALLKYKEATKLIEASRKRLGEIANEFEEIKKEIEK